METQFRKELEELINKHSKENGSDTPDFILARYLDNVLQNFDAAVKEREEWYGRATHLEDLPESTPFPTVEDMPAERDWKDQILDDEQYLGLDGE